MSRVSKQSTTIGILASATATLAAMTAYNIYRARKAEREHAVSRTSGPRHVSPRAYSSLFVAA